MTVTTPKNITIRKPNPADLDTLAEIVVQAFNSIADKHNFPRDFNSKEEALGLLNMFINHPQIHGFVAEDNGSIKGSNFLDQRSIVCGVGPITVAPGVQGSGIGRKLMEAVIELGQDARGIRLVQDAFNTTSFSLYSSLGFEVREPLFLLIGRPQSKFSENQVRFMTPEDLPACGKICTEVHGFERNTDLKDSMDIFKSVVLVKNGQISGYLSAPSFWKLNHGMTRDVDDMKTLMLGAASLHEKPLELLVPVRNHDLLKWLLAEKFRVIKPMTLMSMGYYKEPQGCAFPSVLF